MDWPVDEFPEDPTSPTTTERQLVPEGTHLFTIRDLKEDAAGIKLTLQHEDKAYGWVWGNFPRHADWAKKLVANLMQSLGITPEAWRAASPDDLWSLPVKARVYHKIQDSTGRTFVNIAGFAPPDAEPAAKPAAKRSKTAKAAAAMAEAGGEDHIPF